MDPVTMLACAVAVAIVCGAINVALIVALVAQAIQTRRYRRRSVTAERSLAQHVATAPDVTALLPRAEPDPHATVELISYRHPTERELVAWRNGSEQR